MNKQWLPWMQTWVEWSPQLETRIGILASGAVAMPGYKGFTWDEVDTQLMTMCFLQPVYTFEPNPGTSATIITAYTLSPLGWEYVRCVGNFPDEPNAKDDNRR